MSNLTHLVVKDSVTSTLVNGTPPSSGYNPRIFVGTPEVKFCYLYDFLIEAVLMGTLCLFGFAGNTLSFMVLWREKSKYATPFLLMALAVADTMFLTTVMILRVMTSIYTYTRTTDVVSTHFPYINNYVFPFAQMSLTGTVWLTVLVTLNRYISVCKPYEVSQLCSKRQARRQVVLVTLFSIVYSLPKFFEFVIGKEDHSRRFGNKVYHAYPTAMKRSAWYRIIYNNMTYFLVIFILPLVILMTLNYKLVRALSQARRRRRQLLNQRRDNAQSQEEDVTFTLIIVVVVFVVTQTPGLVTQIFLTVIEGPKQICPYYFFFYSRISDLLVVMNSSTNFLIYCFCSRKFRHILQVLMCGQDARRQHCRETTDHQNPLHDDSPSNAPRVGMAVRTAIEPDKINGKSDRSSIKYGGLNNHAVEGADGENGVAHV